ncbi:MAG TPA: alpha/beta fold hydrolase [Candidatus Limnocylindria bacterium]|nr:alpha/beta fold hydrolase [Candidatus Limnocylindria bacterium]
MSDRHGSEMMTRFPETNGHGDSLPAKQVLRLVRRDLSGQQYFVYIPSSGGVDAPLFVAVHGVAQNAHEQASMFSSYCEAQGVVLVAPLFADDYRDYQRLGRSGRGPRSDAALEAILEEVVLQTGAMATPIYLFGHSGGAQFAHRYAMAHPHRVARVVVVGAGWYTFPNRRRRFPHGIRRSRDLPNVRFDPEEFLRIPMTVMVGEQDTHTGNLRRTERVNRQQGRNRLERARNWVGAMRTAAESRNLDPLVSFESIPAGDNSFVRLMTSGRLGERVFAALFGDHTQ